MVRLGPRPMFAARPLHPAKADFPGSPGDVAEGPISDIRQAKYMGRIERASHPNAEEISQIRPLDCRPGCRRDGIRPCRRFSCGKAGKV